VLRADAFALCTYQNNTDGECAARAWSRIFQGVPSQASTPLAVGFCELAALSMQCAPGQYCCIVRVLCKRIACAVSCAPLVALARVCCSNAVFLDCCVSCALACAAYRVCSCVSAAVLQLGWVAVYSMCYASIMLPAGFAADRDNTFIWKHRESQYCGWLYLQL